MQGTDNPTETAPEVEALQAAARLVVATSLGHEGLLLRRTERDEQPFELGFDDGRTMPAWDGLLLDVAARQEVGACRPAFSACVTDECRKCLASFAVEQHHITNARSVLEDICESAARDVDRYGEAIAAVARELLLREQVDQDFARQVMWG
jgi:hypothetical protein